ncbi:MAG: CBS domain-containing protein [Polyangiaceae bacterium]|nr:CBS domain-containing protein [Polyangiaceae bacterium]
MKVEQLMTRNVATCSPEQPMSEAARLMWERDCGCVPVVEPGGRLVGIITDRDICMSAYTKALPLHQIAIREAMALRVHCCRTGDPIEKAEKIMKEEQVRRLPVTNVDGLLVGILSLNDIAREADREQTNRLPEVGLNGVALTLSAVCQPHVNPS